MDTDLTETSARISLAEPDFETSTEAWSAYEENPRQARMTFRMKGRKARLILDVDGLGDVVVVINRKAADWLNEVVSQIRSVQGERTEAD